MEVKYCKEVIIMLFLISLMIALLAAFLLDKPLKKHPAVFYVTAAVLTVASIAILQSDIGITNRFVREYVIGILSRGSLGAAFWAVVMWAGALPNGSAAIKKLMPIRGELSITAAILTLSHVITYGIQYLSLLIKGRTGSDFFLTSAVSLVMVAIMVPLTVMSFKAIRRKMNAKTWKRIQRAAYVFYALIYVHIMVIFVPRAQSGRDGAFLSVLVYSAVFIGYAAMRLRKLYLAKKKPEAKLIPNIVCACGVMIPLSLAGFAAHSDSSPSDKATAAEEAPAVFTFVPETTAAASTAAKNTSTSATSEVSTVSGQSSAGASTTSAVTTTTEAASAPDEEPETEPGQETHEEEQQSEAPAEPQPVYRYRDGEYEATAEGYAGQVHVKLTISGDVITAITAWADEDDPEFFSDAMNTVIPQIAANVSADGVDACSGATYSSKGIIEAARKALAQAEN